MAIIVNTITRKFEYKDEVLPDPDPSLSPDGVLELYTGSYPEMVTATIVEKEVTDEEITYTIKSNLGTKG